MKTILNILAAVLLTLGALTAHAAGTSYYIYDESGHVIGEYDANGNAVQEHIYLGDRPVAVVQGGSVGYVTTDQLNTPRAVTNASQTSEWSWTSDPFGNGQPTGSLTYNLRFPGQYYDAETGHNYNYNRDYDPGLGRYIESDPIGLNGGINTYAYVGGNPVIKGDSAGEKIDFGNYVFHNPLVIVNLYDLNLALENMGYDSDCFTILVTGGDRYRDSNNPNLIRSYTNNAVVKKASQTSPHLDTRGARAVDFIVTSDPNCGKCRGGITDADLNTAINQTDFAPGNTDSNYPDGPHTHVALPPTPGFSYSPQIAPPIQ